MSDVNRNFSVVQLEKYISIKKKKSTITNDINFCTKFVIITIKKNNNISHLISIGTITCDYDKKRGKYLQTFSFLQNIQFHNLCITIQSTADMYVPKVSQQYAIYNVYSKNHESI